RKDQARSRKRESLVYLGKPLTIVAFGRREVQELTPLHLFDLALPLCGRRVTLILVTRRIESDCQLFKLRRGARALVLILLLLPVAPGRRALGGARGIRLLGGGRRICRLGIGGIGGTG